LFDIPVITIQYAAGVQRFGADEKERLVSRKRIEQS